VEETYHHHHEEGQQGPEQEEEEEEIAMIREQDLAGEQMRAGMEDGRRDPHPSERRNMTPRRTNSLTCCLESWPTPWDNVQESQRNPRPYSERRNTKIYAGGY